MSDTCPIGKIFKINSAIFIRFGTTYSNLNGLFLPKNIIKCKYHVSHSKPEMADFQRDFSWGVAIMTCTSMTEDMQILCRC